MALRSRKRILVLHLAGRYPMGGIGWQAVHYLVGLRRLGHDVFYVEDAGAPPYDPRTRSVVEECAYGVEFLRRTMDRFDLGDRWAYWDQSSGRCHGLDRRDLLGLWACGGIALSGFLSYIIGMFKFLDFDAFRKWFRAGVASCCFHWACRTF